MACLRDGCLIQAIGGVDLLCPIHRLECNEKLKKEEASLSILRSKDPLYVRDLKIFLKISKHMEDLKDSDDEGICWIKINLFEELFEKYYFKESTRLNIIVDLVASTKKSMTGKHSFGDYQYLINTYEIYSKLLVDWVTEQNIIEKNLLIKNLDLVNDVNQMIENIINRL